MHTLILLHILSAWVGFAQCLVCYECLDGENSQICNTTATLMQCQNSQETCFTRVTADGGTRFTTSHKTCMNKVDCKRLELGNSEGCFQGLIKSSCTWCCTTDKCNHDAVTYQRPTAVLPHTPHPQGPTTQCSPVATTNCTTTGLHQCVDGYSRHVDNFLDDDDFPAFCRRVPDVIICLTGKLEACYHPGYLDGVTSLMQEAMVLLKSQCPNTGCNETSAILCTYNFLVKVARIILSPGGSCELIRREIAAHKQCLEVTISACGRTVLTRYEDILLTLTSTVTVVCHVLPATILPPSTTHTYTTTTTTYTTSTLHTTSGAYTTTSYPWKPPGSTKPWLTTTQAPTVLWTPASTVTMPPPTESPDCAVTEATQCINTLNYDIVQQMSSSMPDYTQICSVKLQETIDCARYSTSHCSYFTQSRAEVLIRYLELLLGGACAVTTEPPSVCDTTRARFCIVTLRTLILEKDTAAACRYRANATSCVMESTEGCTVEESDSLYKVLNDTLDNIRDKCTDYVQCSNDTLVILQEGGPSRKITFNFTSPPSVICQDVPGCRVFVDFLHDDAASPRCGNGVPISQIILGNTNDNSGDAMSLCSREITDANWEREHGVTLTARIDFSRDGEQKRDFTVVMRKVVYGVEIERRTVCTFQVIIKDNDTTSVCKSVNDPHIHTFDKIYYNNHYQGIFRLYKHKDYPYEVQTAYQQCWPDKPPTCNCAAYVRAGDTVFVVDKCAKSRHCTKNCSPKLRTTLYYHTEGITPGMKIYSSSNGRTFDVVFPHGTRVRMTDAGKTLINVYIYPSPYDWGRTTGLCGVYDGDTRNDVSDAAGISFNIDKLDTIELRMPVSQVSSWRVVHDEYLTAGYRKDPYVPGSLCMCDSTRGQPDGTSSSSCGPQYLAESCNLALGREITSRLPRTAPIQTFTVSVAGRKRRSAVDDTIPVFDEHYDPFANFGVTSNTWNITSAREYCWDFLQGDSQIQGCLAVPGVDINLEMDICVDDIMTTGETVWAPRARESVLEKCMYEIQTNPVYIETAVGQALADSVMGGICPGDCSGHGQCVQGRCHCANSFVGADCSMVAGGAPQGLYVANNGLCDVDTSDCSQVVIFGDHFVTSGSLACSFTKIQMTDFDKKDGDNETLITSATLLTYQELTCTLPSRLQSYQVKVTLDGTTFSRELLFVPYDSTCYECDANDDDNVTCSRRPETCVIGDECYKKGESHPSDKCMICNPVDSDTGFSRAAGLSCLPHGIVIITICAVVLVLIILCVIACIIFCKKRRGRKESIKSDRNRSKSEAMYTGVASGVTGDKVIINV